MKDICIATEDALSEAVMERLISEVTGQLQVAIPIRGNGYGALKRKVPNLVRMAPSVPVVLLTDLDNRPCPPELINDWLGSYPKPENFLFRIAVREVEAWLLADAENFSRFSRIPISKLRPPPDNLQDPKQVLLNLVKRHSPAALKNTLLADYGSGPRQGPSYNASLTEFVRVQWDPAAASLQSSSLERTRQRIRELADRYHTA